MQTQWRDFMGYTKVGPQDVNAHDYLKCRQEQGGAQDCEPPQLAWLRYQVRTATGKGDKPQDIERSADAFSNWATRVQEVRVPTPSIPPPLPESICRWQRHDTSALHHGIPREVVLNWSPYLDPFTLLGFHCGMIGPALCRRGTGHP